MRARVDPAGSAPEWSGYGWVFGGSYRHSCEQRGHAVRRVVAVGNTYPYLGFRCVRGL